jgi:hypothetical protein
MSLFRFMSIVVVAIAIAILVVSNLNTAYPLVFLTARTIPIPLGWLASGALMSGVLASLLLRFLGTGRQTIPASKNRSKAVADPPSNIADQPNFERSPQPERPAIDDEPEFEVAPSQPRPSVYEANYRVIRPPQNTPQPKVDSNLRPDNEDWGFDFEEDD